MRAKHYPRVVEDTETAFGLRFTECVWADVFMEAGNGGYDGDAPICDMDCAWAATFSPSLRMERDRASMQGHDQCNQRYLSTPQQHRNS